MAYSLKITKAYTCILKSQMADMTTKSTNLFDNVKKNGVFLKTHGFKLKYFVIPL